MENPLVRTTPSPLGAEVIDLALNFVHQSIEHLTPDARLLLPHECKWARESGVKNPDAIRLVLVDSMPRPDNTILAELCQEIGFLSTQTIGLTLDYLILVKTGYDTEQLIRHELRHVHQWEEAGSHRAFLEKYIEQVLTFGYWNAPLEMDARAFEQGLSAR